MYLTLTAILPGNISRVHSYIVTYEKLINKDLINSIKWIITEIFATIAEMSIVRVLLLIMVLRLEFMPNEYEKYIVCVREICSPLICRFVRPNSLFF